MKTQAAAVRPPEASPLARIDRAVGGRDDVVRLHQGKTHFRPCHVPRPWGRADFDLLAHEHAPPRGSGLLREAVALRASASRPEDVDPADVVITNGATHGISSALRSVIDPGAEVLVPSPQWLFATGVIAAAGGVPVEVPVFVELQEDPGFDFVTALEARTTSRTGAIYFSNPNNPTGFSMDARSLARLVDFAAAHDLWIVTDNAYEHFDFSPGGFVDVATLPGAAARTFAVHTFSKSFAMPGYRVGYVVTPPGRGESVVSTVLFSVYSVSTASQFAAFDALGTPAATLAERRGLAQDAWRFVHAALEIPHSRVDGGLYTLLDLSGWGPGTAHFLDRCLAAGVTLAPGSAFGGHCARYARLCFTAVEPEALRRGVTRLNEVWEEES